ncbi:MAG TPA: cupin domain-containing protein [Fodinibius sp.]|nr:cupin domain-containing protein [Fodinibius sp.]
MSQGHIKTGEVINLETLRDGMPGNSTFALIKTDDMEVIRMVMPRGRDIMEHSVKGEMSVQCLKGGVIFQVEDKAHELTEGDWLHLSHNQPHAVHAKVDSVLLLTILFSENTQEVE